MKSKASSSSTTGKSKPMVGIIQRFLSLLDLRRQRFQLKDLYAATNSGCDREKGFSVVALIMMTRPLFGAKAGENLAWFYQGDGFHPKAGPNHQKIWPPLRFLEAFLLANRCIKGPEAYSIVPAIAVATGSSDARRSIENHRGQTVGFDHGRMTAFQPGCCWTTDEWIDRP